MDHIVRHTKRVFVGISGGMVVFVGIILIPYPGPGWLIVFSGLALLATEFDFARRTLAYVRTKYDHWAHRMKQQHGAVRAGALLATGMLVVLSMWAVNGFGIAAQLLQLDISWLSSPFLG